VKPSPPASLLPDGHVWWVVPAREWKIAGPRKRCRYDIGLDLPERCGAPAVAAEFISVRGTVLTMKYAKGYCAEHIGAHQWIADGHVWRWRAVKP
jgi:hypothetical protein